MKFNLNKYLLGLSVVGLLFSSCSEEVPPQSTVQTAEPIVFSASDVTAVSLAEGGTYVYELPMPATQIYDVHVNVARSNQSTAISGRDYEVTYGAITVPALGPGEIAITIPSDNNFDDGETVYFTISGESTDLFPLQTGDAPLDVLAITIANTPPSDTRPGLLVDWAGEFTFFGTIFHWQDFIDLDFFFENDGNLFSGADGFSMATGGVPEIVYAEEFVGDGTYNMHAHLYGGLAGNGIPDFLPIAVAIFDPNSGGEVDMVAEGIIDWTGDTPDDDSYTNTVFLGTVTISGGGTTLSFSDANGNSIGTVGN